MHGTQKNITKESKRKFKERNKEKDEKEKTGKIQR
jgi:hypothetical protein